jgi:hypothetical protein
MTPALTRTEAWSLLVLFGVCAGIVANTLQGDGNPLSASIAFSGAAFAVSFCLIRWLGDTFMKAGLKGKDMSKARKVEMSVTRVQQTVHFGIDLTGAKQTRDHGCCVRRRLSLDDYRVHTVALLQGIGGSNFRRR